MHYLSPASLLEQAIQLPIDPKILSKARKKLLADLELDGGDTINLNGRPFTKNELIHLFDELEKQNITTYHLAISEDPTLLKFLEQGTIDDDASFKDADIYNDPHFTTWLSPYFYTTLTEFVKDCFDRTNAAGMRTILHTRHLMTPEHKQQSFLFIAGILERNIALFNHYRGQSRRHTPGMMPLHRISAYIGHGYIEVIKQLPNNQFARLKDLYAHSMQHPAIATFNRIPHNRSLAIIWVEEALTLAVSEQVKAGIRSKLNELNSLIKKAENRTRPLIIVGIVALTIIIGNVVNSAVDNPSSTPTPTYLSQPTHADTTIGASDSVIIRAHKKGIN